MKKTKVFRLPTRSEAALPQDDESQSAQTSLPVLEHAVERDTSIEPSAGVPQAVLPV
jgi:hypothetical protein